jgi:hypothetical protein
MTQVTLQTLIDQQATLTEAQKESLFTILASGAHKQTKEKLASRIELPLSLWSNWGIYGRVHLEADGRFSYCAGQDYAVEIVEVRKLIIKG